MNNKKGIPVYLSEKEIRVIKVALWKHLRNIADDNGDAYKEEMQSFVDCCYETYRAFEGLDDEKKKFDELDKKHSFDKITLVRKSAMKKSMSRKDKIFEEILYYNVGSKTAIIYACIDNQGRAAAYDDCNGRYWFNTGYYDAKIPEPVLDKLCELARYQVIEDYKLSLVAKDYKSFLNKNRETGGTITVRVQEPEKYYFDNWEDAINMRTLCFEQITDDRFDDDIYNLLETRVKTLKELLNIDGVEVRTDDICEINFVKNKQYRCKFYVTKSTKKVTWNDIFKIVNSVNPVPYLFID